MADSDILNEVELLQRARGGDRDAFQRLAEPHRAELQLHCYRMLGSLHDAEDLVQETYLRAWRGLAKFDARTSFRRWLYRIATNACLNALASRKSYRRVLPDARGMSSDQMPGREPASDIAWLEPYPDVALEGIADDAPGPDARYELREAVQLAFIAAIQLLPPRQRAALLLRDVLGWSAAEVARLLDASVPSVNSALQRARAMLEKKLPTDQPRPAPSRNEQLLLERYLHSWEGADVDAFAALLKEDAIFSMPPWPEWYRGRDAISTLFRWIARPGGHGPFRLVPTAANGQHAFAFYSRFQGTEWRAHSIQLLSMQGESIAAMTSFVLPALFPAFGLPVILSEAKDLLLDQRTADSSLRSE